MSEDHGKSTGPEPAIEPTPAVQPSGFPTEEMFARIDDLIREAGEDPASFDGRLLRDLLGTSLKLIRDERETGELKLITAAVKEIRHAYRVFARYQNALKISIFGSARTPPGHPDYLAAVEFSKMMAAKNWLCITGAGDGIMKAGHEGPGREASFGLSIRLPFETTANSIITGDEKLINFRYFFTRKLMFVSQADAIACFPGGFGTQDEAFEILTLIQTGKSEMKPIVMVEGEHGDYWRHWENYIRRSLLEKGFISPEDRNLYYIAEDPADAVQHVTRFYRNYHSSRYVRDDYVIRLRAPLRADDVEVLNAEFGNLVKTGRIEQRDALPEESGEHADLPRLVFTHTRRQFGLVRTLIDRINSFDPAKA
ncbi:MAG: LOG family protein [Phycisphaerales bacterium]